MILELWKNLRLQNQLLIIQSIIVGIIFVILISSCLYLIQLFSVFIQQELLQQLVLNSMVSTIQTAIFGVDNIGQLVYNQIQAEDQYIKKLYQFQVENNINTNSQIDNCLQSPHSLQFDQFCYDLYGQDSSQLDLNKILNYTALQNQLIPFFLRKIQPVQIQNLVNQYLYPNKKDTQLKILINKCWLLFNRWKAFKLLTILKDKQICLDRFFCTANQSENSYYELIQSEQYFNQRLVIVLDNGLILSDSIFNGMQFQNTSGLGFNNDQFQIIKNFANKNGSLINECKFQFKIQILCLKNMKNIEQLVFSKNLVQSGFYVIVMVDTIFFNQIEDDFNQQLYSLIDDLLIKIGIQYLIAFIICIMLQIAFIKRLNRPLEDLQKAAQSHINDYQYTFQIIASVRQAQNQTQKLAVAFFNLINLNNSKQNKVQQLLLKNNNEFQESKGTILRRQSLKIIRKIRRLIQKRFDYVNIFN